MSHQSKIAQLLATENIDIRVAKVGLLISLLLLGLRTLAEQVLLVVIPVAAGTAFALYLLTQQHASRGHAVGYGHRTTNAIPVVPRQIAGYLPSAVFVCLAALVLLVHSTGGRSLQAHLLIGLIGVLLFSQILMTDDATFSPGLVLGELLLVTIVVRFTALLATPGYIGVDIWTHGPIFISDIVSEGSLAAIADVKYIMAPIYHLNGAAGALIFGSPRLGIYLSVGLLVALSILLVYAIAGLLLPTRWALVATGLFAFADEAIRWGIHVIPTSLGLVFFLGIVYCLTRFYFTRDTRLLALVLLFSLATVFTHQVSTTIVLLVLGIAVFTSLVVRLPWFRRPESPGTAGLFGVFAVTLVVTLISWANTPFSGDFIFLWRMLDVLEHAIVGEAGFLNLASDGGAGGAGGAPADEMTGVDRLYPFVQWTGFGLLLAVTIIGSLVWLKRDVGDLGVTYLLWFAAMFFVAYGFSLFGLRTFMPGRWLAFLFVPMAILGAVGLYHVSQNATTRTLLVVFVVLALAYPTTMVLAEKSTLDSPAFENQDPRFSYTMAEIAAVDTVSDIRPVRIESEIETDHPYRSLFERVAGYESPTVTVDDTGQATGTSVVAREYQHQGPATIHEMGDPVVPRQSHTFLQSSLCSETRNTVYNNGEVTLCTASYLTGGDGP